MLGVTFMKLIVADIGGTNARFAVSEKGNPSLRHITYLRCSDFEGFEDAFERFLAGLPRDEQSGHHLLSLAVAGLLLTGGCGCGCCCGCGFSCGLIR